MEKPLELFSRNIGSEIETLSEFGDLLTQQGLTYETSLFTRWQNSERVPRDRRVLLSIVRIFIKLGGIQDISEVNAFFEAVDQRDITEEEVEQLNHYFYSNRNRYQPSKNGVFFFSSPIFSTLDKQVDLIYNEIEQLGFSHIYHETQTHLLRELIKGVENGEDIRIDEYKRNLLEAIEKVKIANICIFETSSKSIGTGYLIHQALQNNKPTIILYYKNHKPHIFSVEQHNNMILKSYNDNNLHKVVKSVMRMTDKKLLSARILTHMLHDHVTKKF